MDYNIIKQHLKKPKQLKKKKEKIDFVAKAIDLRTNFVVPNKQSYTTSQDDNDIRLDNELNAVIKMNDIFNTRSFYFRDYVYWQGMISFAGEYFCRLYNFDGIYIRTEITENEYPAFTINEDLAKINILSKPKENLSIIYITKSCSYVINTLLSLSIFNQYKNCANVLNYKSHSFLDEYLCLLHIMDTSLKLYNQEKAKNYYIFDHANSITYYATTNLCQAIQIYYPTFKDNIENENKENFIFALNQVVYTYCFNKQTNTFYTLKDLMLLDNTILKSFTLHFSRRQNGKNIITSLNNFTETLLHENFATNSAHILKCMHTYYDDYINSAIKILPNNLKELLTHIININGYFNSPYLCKALLCLTNNDRKYYNYFLKLYLEQTPYNTINIRYKITKALK